MSPDFDILDVSDWPVDDDEPVGGKRKTWLRHGEDLWLCKWPEDNQDRRHGIYKRGEDWAEMLAYAVTCVLGLPAAEVRLGVRQGEACVLSRGFLREGDRLDHGNELLLGLDPAYDEDTPGHYTVERAFDALRSIDSLEGPDGGDPLAAFAGYLVLDALVNNLDRHHENWAVLSRTSGPVLAPSYDHGSAFASSEPDARRRQVLERIDGVSNYLGRAGTCWYPRMHPVDVAHAAIALAGPASFQWLTRLEAAADELLMMPDRLPSERWSADAAALSRAILRERLGTLTQPPGMVPT